MPPALVSQVADGAAGYLARGGLARGIIILFGQEREHEGARSERKESV